MKYTTALLAFAAGAFAQSSAVTSAPSTTDAPVLPPSISCVSACTPGDVTCQASCLGIARPNSSQVVATNECAAECDQGSGSAEDTQKYSDCVQSCIANLFPSSQTGSMIPGAAAPSRSASGTAANSANTAASTRASGSGSGSSSVSQTGSAAPQATGAANSFSAHIGSAGLAGLLAVFAL